jgi:hypothetical protein
MRLLNKLRVSANFIIFGPTNKKLWMFEVFRRSLGRAGMYRKRGGKRKIFLFAKGGFRAPAQGQPAISNRSLAAEAALCPSDCGLFFFFKLN